MIGHGGLLRAFPFARPIRGSENSKKSFEKSRTCYFLIAIYRNKAEREVRQY